MPTLWIKYWIKRIYFFGFFHRCNACGSFLRKWQWHGQNTQLHFQYDMLGSGKRRCLCPICHSIDRERLMLLYLAELNKTDVIRKARILHIAPEKSVMNWFSRHSAREYIKGDFFTDGYAYDHDTMHLNLEELPFENGSFDLVLCSHVLEHVINIEKAMTELSRVSDRSVKILLMVPLALNLEETIEGGAGDTEEFRTEHFGQFDHVRLFGADFPQWLEAHGWFVECWSPSSKVSCKWGTSREVIWTASKSKINAVDG